MKSCFYFLLLFSAACYAAPPADAVIEVARPDGIPQFAYPSAAERHGEEGLVVLKMRVLADGSTNEVIVFKSSGSQLLDSAALKSAMGIRFFPAKNKSGIHIDSSVLLPVQYKLLPEKSK